MKTEENVKETMRAERRKVFWRLYSLPWIITVLILAGIAAAFLWYIRDLHIRSFEKETNIRLEGIVEGRKAVQIEAIDEGYGVWEVDRYGIVKFTWKPLIIPIPKTIEKSFETESKQPKKVRQHPYTWEDHRFGKSLGMNLEESIVGSARTVIQYTLLENPKDEDLERLLKDRVEESIRKEFDGFETYHKVR